MGILFVCTNNVCRSPMAEAVLRAKWTRAGRLPPLRIASAGTSAAGAGQPYDLRAVSAAARRGYAFPRRKSRAVAPQDFGRFSTILAMDEGNLRALREMHPEGAAGRVSLLLSLTPDCGSIEVPDPYFGSLAAFERVLDLIEPAADALLRELHERGL